MSVGEEVDVRHQTSQKDPLPGDKCLSPHPPNLPALTLTEKQALLCAM